VRILEPWVRGEFFKLGEHEWEPRRAKLTVLEGPELKTEEIGLGRGWQNAARHGTDVTARVVSTAQEHAAASSGVPATDALAAFKEVVRAQCDVNRLAIQQVLWLANSRHPEWRVSERLALSERAVWELLHQGRVRMVRRRDGDDGPTDVGVAKEQWGRVLLSWASWSDAGAPRHFLIATDAT
jgi:hypothetical protein